jgi:hypothetical protein
MKKTLFLVLATLLSGCGTGPEIVKGKGNIFGQVDARPHKEFIKKIADTRPLEYHVRGDNSIAFTPEMVNYDKLDEIYVGLINPSHNGQAEHILTIADNGLSRRSVMVAKGDVLKVRNNSAGTRTFYLINPATDDIEEFPPIPPGQAGNLIVVLEGLLELGADEDDAITVSILSARNLVSQQVRSGGVYAFTGLDPGPYDVLFWYWRLGKLEHRVEVKSDTNHQIDETLSVDRVVR